MSLAETIKKVAIRIKRILFKIWITGKLFVLYIFFSIRNSIKRLPKNQKAVVISLEDEFLFSGTGGCGRQAYNILRCFSQMGYAVYFHKHITPYGFIRLRNIGRFIYSIKNLKFVDRVSEKSGDLIYAFDTAVPKLAQLKWKKRIYLNILKPTYYQYGEVINVPFDMFPWMYHYKQDQRLPELRGTPKRMRVFFGGNTSKGYYDNLDIRRYGQITRREGIQAVLNGIKEAQTVNDVKDFIKSMNNGRTKMDCVLLRTEKASHVERKNWLAILARSEFFLCLSGTDYPMSHNTIEAMALGVIPILGYSDWFYPNLEHMNNAIIYSGEQDLVNKIKEVLALPESKIRAMKQNVIDYYNQYMTAQVVDKALSQNQEDICTLMLYPNLIVTFEEEKTFQDIRTGLEETFGQFNEKRQGVTV